MISSYYHAAVTDPTGCVPEFLRYLHEFVAQAMTARLAELHFPLRS